MKELTPTEIVAALDRHIVGQRDAKRAVAIAIRNRWRRRQLAEDLRDVVMPKNIILIGSTGVGKTEIARRVAQLVKSPFVKVEASKYTEVGYHGRDVESMVRDLVDASLNLVRGEELRKVWELNQEFAQKLPEVRDINTFVELQREYGQSVWEGVKSGVQTRGEIVKGAVEQTGGLIRDVFSTDSGAEEVATEEVKDQAA